MQRDWEDIKWIFEPDGSLRDIYVQDVSLSDREKVVDLLNENYQLRYGITGGERNSSQIDKQDIINFLTDETGEMFCRSAAIDLGGVHAYCHFFLAEQIEFDIDPKKITSFGDYDKVLKFMQSISWALEQQITLTDENTPEFPLVKVDVVNNINIALTLREAQALRGKGNTLIDKIEDVKASLEMKLFPKEFKEQILKSASEVYKPAKRNKNIW